MCSTFYLAVVHWHRLSTYRDNNALNILFFEVLRSLDLITKVEPWVSQVPPEPLYENEDATAFWDVPLFADTIQVKAKRIDSTVIDKTSSKHVRVIEMYGSFEGTSINFLSSSSSCWVRVRVRVVEYEFELLNTSSEYEFELLSTSWSCWVRVWVVKYEFELLSTSSSNLLSSSSSSSWISGIKAKVSREQTLSPKWRKRRSTTVKKR